MNRFDLARWLVHHTRRLLPPLALSALARIANQLLGIALLVVAASVLVAAASGTPPALPALIATLAGIALAKAFLRYAEHYAGHWVAFTALQRLRELFFERLVPQAPAATSGRAGAELTARATRDIDRIEVFFAHTFPPAISAVAVPAIALAWLASAADPRLAGAIAPFVATAIAVVPLVASRGTWAAAHAVAGARGALSAHLGDDIQGVREVLAFAAGDARLTTLDAADRRLAAARGHVGRGLAIRACATTLLQAGALTAPVLVGLAAGVPTGDIALAVAVAIGLAGPARGIDDFVTGLDAAFAATARVRRIIDAPPAVRDSPAVEAIRPAPIGPPTPPEAGVRINDVTLTYPGAARPALRGVNAAIAPGTWTYVVGVSGSGKSTLATLLLRGRDPEKGCLSLNGVDLRDLRLDDLRGHVALVTQRPTLLSGTIADNLRLANPDADDAALAEALHTADLDGWVASLPQGLDTPTRERGTSVSGGQLQRLALARALVAQPRILVLDEALSQLDAAGAALVRERLRALLGPLTVIEITHRADLIPDDAPVLVLDDARLVETGRAGDLRAAGEAFARLEARV
ncbi:MAG: ABC transporter ATP-binding protein [Propioniciclava sp.]|uniref:ABC transporter ATP-binding protein n=1 Tax=Propioniciclava sp. TaxID=2038686 RepID=UPI0039E3BDDD